MNNQKEILKDINEEEVEVSVSADGKVLWVNGPRGCILRVSGLKKVSIVDARPFPVPCITCGKSFTEDFCPKCGYARYQALERCIHCGEIGKGFHFQNTTRICNTCGVNYPPLKGVGL